MFSAGMRCTFDGSEMQFWRESNLAGGIGVGGTEGVKLQQAGVGVKQRLGEERYGKNCKHKEVAAATANVRTKPWHVDTTKGDSCAHNVVPF